jgi:hypothetical protein
MCFLRVAEVGRLRNTMIRTQDRGRLDGKSDEFELLGGDDAAYCMLVGRVPGRLRSMA